MISKDPAKRDVSLVINHQGKKKVVLKQTLQPNGTATVASWKDVGCTLAAYRGQDVELEIACSGPIDTETMVLIGSPMILSEHEETRPNLIVLSIGTLRADRLSLYGHHRPTSPFLDRLASRGVTVEKAYSTSGYTLPSHASLFSGQYPSTHGSTDGMTPLIEQVSPMLGDILEDLNQALAAAKSFSSLAA